MQDVYVIGAYSTRFQKWPDKTFKDLSREAYLGVLDDAGLESGDDIEIAYFGNCGLGSWGQACIRGQVCFTPPPWCARACSPNGCRWSTSRAPAPPPPWPSTVPGRRSWRARPG